MLIYTKVIRGKFVNQRDHEKIEVQLHKVISFPVSLLHINNQTSSTRLCLTLVIVPAAKSMKDYNNSPTSEVVLPLLSHNSPYCDVMSYSVMRLVLCFKPPHITTHLLPPGGSLGLLDFSISPIIISNDFDTFSLYLALASVHGHLNSSPSFLPCSDVTCRCSGRKSDLLPTMIMGTQSAP